MKKTAQPYNLFKDPTQPVRVCRACGEEMYHKPFCEFTPEGAQRTNIGWVSWLVPVPVLEKHLTPVPVEQVVQDA